MDIQQKFLPKALAKFNGIICIQFADLQNKYISGKTIVISPSGFQI